MHILQVGPRTTRHIPNPPTKSSSAASDHQLSSGTDDVVIVSSGGQPALKRVAARPRASSNTATNTSTKNGTVTTVVSVAEGATTTSTDATGSSDNALQAILNRNERRVQEVEQRREANRSTRKGFMCCTIPLYALFGIQIALVVAVFIAIIVAVNATTMDVTSGLISHGVENTLMYAASEITSPIAAAEGALSEYRNRYLAHMVISDDSLEPCDYRSPLLGGSSTFYADVVLMLASYPLIGTFFAVKRIAPITSDTLAKSEAAVANGDIAGPFSDIADDISLCSVTDLTVLRRLAVARNPYLDVNGNASVALSGSAAVAETTRLPAISECGSLDTAIPRLTRPLDDYSEHEDRQVSIVLNTPRFTWVPRIRVDPHTGAPQYTIVGTAPIAVNVTYAQSAATSSMVVHHLHSERTADSFTVGVDGVVRVDVVSGIGCVLDLSDSPTLLKAITPSHPLAHTSLYITDDVLLASSYLTTEQLNTFAGEHFIPTGKTGIATLDFASLLCVEQHDTVTGSVGVFMDGLKDPQTGEAVIVSCYAFALPITNELLGVVQSTPRSFYFGEVTSLRTMLIALGVCSAVVVIFISAFIGIAVNVGVSQLLKNMSLAASLKNRETRFIRNFVSEIEQLAKGFGQMNDRLLVAIPYLPQHLLATTDESGGEGRDNDDEGTAAIDVKTTTLSGQRTHMSNASSGQRAGTHWRAHGKRASRKSGSSGSAPTAPQQSAGGGLLAKRVTLLVLNARNLHGIVNVNTPSTIHKPTTDLTQLVVEAAHGHKGVIDSFHGDHFVVSFNAARQCAEGPLKAAHCALEIGAAGHSIGRLFAMGISSGRACVGNLGCATAKRLSIIGPVYSKAMALEKLCRRFNAPLGSDISNLNTLTQCVVDGSMASEIHHSFVLQVLGGVYGTPFAQPPSTQYDAAAAKGVDTDAAPVKGSRADPSSSSLYAPPEIIYALRMQIGAMANGDEWLYEMQNSKHGPMGDLNKAMLRYVDSCTTALLMDGAVGGSGGGASAPKKPSGSTNAQRAVTDLAASLAAMRSRADVTNNVTPAPFGPRHDDADDDAFGQQYGAESMLSVTDVPTAATPSGLLTHEEVLANCLAYSQHIVNSSSDLSSMPRSVHGGNVVQSPDNHQRLILNGCPAYNCRMLSLPPAIFTI